MSGQLQHPRQLEDLEHLEDVLEPALVPVLGLGRRRLGRGEQVAGHRALAPRHRLQRAEERGEKV